MNDSVEKIRKIVKSDVDIHAFCMEHQIDDALFERNLSLFFQHTQDMQVCRKCMGKKSCGLDPIEYQSQLTYKEGNIERKYIKCPYLNRFNEECLEMMFFPEVPDNDELFVSEARTDIYKAIKAFNKNPLKGKGMFIHGPFGTGKTFILLKIAQEMTKKGIHVLFAYYPDLVRHMKSQITLGGIESLIKKMKDVPILMLDDVGGETNTAYIRDEVLGPILQYRMFAMKPTFMSSNYELSQLHDHFKETKDTTDELKSSRIIERINFMMTSLELKDQNYRRG
ncbi:MAG: ATP-binding protein [Bacilli bacterium]|nr:ATP-binding protein [Bacilli bacterium]